MIIKNSDHTNTENDAIGFILITRDLILSGYEAKQIFNADQCVFNYFITKRANYFTCMRKNI